MADTSNPAASVTSDAATTTSTASSTRTAYDFVFVEIPCADQQAACDFYRGVFGWDAQLYPEFNYAGAEPGGSVGIGFPLIDGRVNLRGQVVAYVSTPDINATIAQATALGGSTVVAPFAITNVGHFAVIDDSTGGRLGLFTYDPDAQ